VAKITQRKSGRPQPSRKRRSRQVDAIADSIFDESKSLAFDWSCRIVQPPSFVHSAAHLMSARSEELKQNLDGEKLTAWRLDRQLFPAVKSC
jgi:hypothetical protein